MESTKIALMNLFQGQEQKCRCRKRTCEHTEETRIETYTCTPMFIATLFTIARTRKQPRCQSTDEWIKMLWHMYTMKYYSAIKKNEFELLLVSWMKLQPIIQREVSQKESNKYHILTHICIGEGNGSPLQYSCLENPRDGGAWWAAVYGVAQSRTRLKRLSSSRKLLYNIGSSTRCSVMTQRGRMGERDGRLGREWIYIHIYLIHIVIQQKLTQHCKATIRACSVVSDSL